MSTALDGTSSALIERPDNRQRIESVRPETGSFLVNASLIAKHAYIHIALSTSFTLLNTLLKEER